MRMLGLGAWLVVFVATTGCNQAEPETDGPGSTPASEQLSPGTGGMPNEQDPVPGGMSSSDEMNGTEEAADVITDVTGPDGAEDSTDPGSTAAVPSEAEPSVPESAETDVGEPPIDSTLQNVEEYFPLADGGSWVYRHTHLVDGEWLEEVTMEATTYDDKPAFLVSDSPDLDQEISLQTWQQSGTAITRVYREQVLDEAVILSVGYDPGFLRFDTRWDAPGIVTVNTYRREETKADGTNSAAIREQTFTVLETTATVDVEAGTFDECLLVERVRADNASTALFWFARGVGKVREEDPETQTVEELVNYALP